MKKILFILLLLALPLAACVSGGAREVTYTVTVLDSEGNAAVGVMVQLCKDEACLTPKRTDANGNVAFTLDAGEPIGDYHLTLTDLPAGQIAEGEYRFSPGMTVKEIRLTK